MSILKIILVPLSLILSLFVWLCAGLLSCSGFVFKLASGLLSLLAIAVMITYSVKNGIILLVLAFLISPMGLPLLAVQGLGVRLAHTQAFGRPRNKVLRYLP